MPGVQALVYPLRLTPEAECPTVIATGAQLTGYSTIDELFDQIRSATPALTVEFDRSLGYPTRIERCCLEDDSGSVTTISSLIPSS